MLFGFLKQKRQEKADDQQHWRERWQSLVPEENRSVPVTVDGQTRIAYIQINQFVVMLQDRDAKTAEEIILDDDKLDALHHKTFDLALSDKWTGSRQQLIDVVLLGRFMERLGDHAVSASRRVVYIVSGFDPSKEPSRDEDGAVE